VADTLSVAVAQPVLPSCDVAGSARVHATVVRAGRARVVVFPELSLTGYELDAQVITIADPRLHPIVEACAETGSIALAGAPVADESGQAAIAMLAIDGTGVGVAYRKLWLGAEEARRFRPGPAPAVLEVDGWRLGLAICRDTGIPGHAADTAALGMDAYLAGTVKRADEADVQYERGRGVAAERSDRLRARRDARPDRARDPGAGMRRLVRGLALGTTALVFTASVAFAASPSPSAPVAGDTRSAGEGPGLVGAPLLAILLVVALGVGTALVTLAYVRFSRPTTPGDESG
jgi:hypothetical protein